MSLVFDHTKENFSEAMGLRKEEPRELAMKLSKITKDFVKSEMKNSELAEQLALELSYSELVFISANHVINTAKEALLKMESSTEEQLKELLSKLKKELGDD
jgi:glucosamine 6-phosphate synthetase-like amidotransferase/phosphosugar isomerase protein